MIKNWKQPFKRYLTKTSRIPAAESKWRTSRIPVSSKGINYLHQVEHKTSEVPNSRSFKMSWSGKFQPLITHPTKWTNSGDFWPIRTSLLGRKYLKIIQSQKDLLNFRVKSIPLKNSQGNSTKTSKQLRFQ